MLICKKKVIQREFGPNAWWFDEIIYCRLCLDENIEEALYDFENYVNKYCFIKHYKVNDNGIYLYKEGDNEYSGIEANLEVDEEYYNNLDKQVQDYFE